MAFPPGLVLQKAVINDGIEIHYVRQGEGPALVFVHGGMGDWSSWAPQWPAFTVHYCCYSYSRRFSSPNKNSLEGSSHSVFCEARDLIALLLQWPHERFILVGTSYGAYTALQAALTWPEKILAMALTEPPVLAFTDRSPGGAAALRQFQQEVLQPSNLAFAEGHTELAVRLLTEGINGGGTGEAFSPEGRTRRLRNALAMQALALSQDPYPALDEQAMRGLAMPILLMRGENTAEVHRATFEAVKALIPQARVLEMAGSGHGVHREVPHAFNQAVLSFLREHGISTPAGPQCPGSCSRSGV